MEISKLSWMFHFACSRIHDTVDDMYEALHNEEGSPVESMKDVYEVVQEAKRNIYEELDLIKTIIDEHEEISSSS
tara:strand:+ start:169 stop:393 length:225 start_codon:yes stop_codon:yes gene_type:complete